MSGGSIYGQEPSGIGCTVTGGGILLCAVRVGRASGSGLVRRVGAGEPVIGDICKVEEVDSAILIQISFGIAVAAVTAGRVTDIDELYLAGIVDDVEMGVDRRLRLASQRREFVVLEGNLLDEFGGMKDTDDVCGVVGPNDDKVLALVYVHVVLEDEASFNWRRLDRRR